MFQFGIMVFVVAPGGVCIVDHLLPVLGSCVVLRRLFLNSDGCTYYPVH
jgi:hypothetical protein